MATVAYFAPSRAKPFFYFVYHLAAIEKDHLNMWFQTCFMFTPEAWGKWIIFDFCIFFKWVKRTNEVWSSSCYHRWLSKIQVSFQWVLRQQEEKDQQHRQPQQLRQPTKWTKPTTRPTTRRRRRRRRGSTNDVIANWGYALILRALLFIDVILDVINTWFSFVCRTWTYLFWDAFSCHAHHFTLSLQPPRIRQAADF